MTKKLVILIIGPESSSTRAFTTAFQDHPQIMSCKPAEKHIDLLDEVWFELEHDNLKGAIEKFPKNPNRKIIVTRRSIPHGLRPGLKAKYGSFPNVSLLSELCKSVEYSLFILITSRSPIPNLMSWTQQRASAGKSMLRAYNQYQMAFRRIFSVIEAFDLPYFVTSVECFVLDGQQYIRSLHKFFELKDLQTDPKIKPDLNAKHYDRFLA